MRSAPCAEEVCREVRQRLAEGRARAHQRHQIIAANAKWPVRPGLATHEQMKSQLTSLAHWLQRRAENIAVAVVVRDVCDLHRADLRALCAQQSGRVVGRSDHHDLALDRAVGAAFILRESEEIRFDIIYSQVSPNARDASFTVLTGVALIVLYGDLAACRLQATSAS